MKSTNVQQNRSQSFGDVQRTCSHTLYSAHDDAVMIARRFRITEIRALLLENSFAIRRLTYWTTLLFPFAVLARTLGASKTGRDFPAAAGGPPGFADYLSARTMALERSLLKKLSLPFGVALLAAATKRVVRRR